MNNDLSELIEIFQTNKVVATGEEEIEIGLEANRLSTFDLPVVEHENVGFGYVSIGKINRSPDIFNYCNYFFEI